METKFGHALVGVEIIEIQLKNLKLSNLVKTVFFF